MSGPLQHWLLPVTRREARTSNSAGLDSAGRLLLGDGKPCLWLLCALCGNRRWTLALPWRSHFFQWDLQAWHRAWHLRAVRGVNEPSVVWSALQGMLLSGLLFSGLMEALCLLKSPRNTLPTRYLGELFLQGVFSEKGQSPSSNILRDILPTSI